MKEQHYEVIIIGGSYAGLSAAMALGRSLRKVLILDSGLPCNRQTPHSHNFLTQDGVAPHKLAKIAKEQVLQYNTVTFLSDIALTAKKEGEYFKVTSQAGKEFYSNKLVLATGIKDEIPSIEGFKECWGISLIHCPYCHGYEYHHKKTGILANSDRAFHLASLINNLTNDITIFTRGKANFTEEQILKLEEHHINIVEQEITALQHEHGYLNHVILKNQAILPFDVLYGSFPFIQHSTIPVSLGCELTENGYIKINNLQQTSINGVYACGDNATPMRSVAAAIAGGNLAGAMINKELIDDDF
ncbi:NAD(P)/FAD-dependent oxidoreductase [Zhouia sp. PK063]|uniref:NAD(P)/FAD-dependent oxidoreductase n=1 Tax=Zhouia sp. PK063 TaxID=3373602 RepID=UPI0037887644